MSGFILRLIALTAMVADHIGWSFLENPMILTWIGRIAFPLYALMLAEGFIVIHTDRDRLCRHFSLLLILAVVSEPGYDLMDAGRDLAHYLDSQSNMITLLLGYLGMMATEAMLPQGEGKRALPARKVSLVCAYALLGFANYMLHGNFILWAPGWSSAFTGI